MKALIEACQKSTKDGREALLAIDISGPNENFINDTLDGLLSYATKNKEKLNFVLIIDGDPKKKDQGKSTSKDHKGKKRSKKGGRR
jgi:16S rRNA C1402 (ribose-2'-O) methylase RsmI